MTIFPFYCDEIIGATGVMGLYGVQVFIIVKIPENLKRGMLAGKCFDDLK